MDDVARSTTSCKDAGPPARSPRRLRIGALLACVGLAALAVVLPIGAVS